MVTGESIRRADESRRTRTRRRAGETQPTLAAAKAIARALGISIDELAGDAFHRVDLGGEWWACWQTWRDGTEVINPHQIRVTQRGDALDVIATTRGTPLDEGGYLWRGELRVWDNEAVMGWYAADEGAVRSKGTVYFALHPHGIHMTGRWVGLSYDGPIVSGWGVIAHRGRGRRPDEPATPGGSREGMSDDEVCEVIITADSADWLADFTRALVEDRLAACGQNIAPIRSIYRWEGKVQDEPEARVALHTRAALVSAIVDRADRDHPYDVPCVIALPVVSGNPGYISWVLDSTHE